jgi:hypothetical protein
MAGYSPSHHNQMTNKKPPTPATNAAKVIANSQVIESGIGQKVDLKA